MQLFSPLSHPVGALMRSVATLTRIDSLARAASFAREAACEFVPVTEEGRLVGIVTERSLAECLGRGLEPLSTLEPAMRTVAAAVPMHATGAEALRRLQQEGVSELPVVDADGRFMGIIGASDLFPRYEEPPQLPMIGGMATPFGVYLTAGGVRGGAGPFALIATGMLLFTVFLGATLGGEALIHFVAEQAKVEAVPDWVFGLVPYILFLGTIRFIPLSGIHAAEHKTVHAMEWGEPLDLEVVRRMPRVHPRCGTNLAVGVSLFLTLASWRWVDDETLRLLVAMIATVAVWRPLGHFVQQYVTTKRPTDRQLESGIQAGRDLIRNYQLAGRSRIHFGHRLLASGMFHVMAGSFLMYAIVEGLARLMGYSLGL